MLPGINLFNLEKRSALVTGGTKGLGRAMTEGLASAGADVVITSRNAEEATHVASEIARIYGTRIVGIQGDVSSPKEVDVTINTTLAEFGKLDILINNAGINIRGPIEELSYETFRAVQRVNLDGVWLTARAAIPHMKRAGYGRIINVASTLGLVGLEGRSPYASSKGAVVQLTRTLGLELAPFDVTCNAICPGPFLTRLNEPIAETEDGRRIVEDLVPLKRWGRLEEIQGAAIFLASNASSYMTGSLVTVDGGWTAR
jgi:NAD(P)-dependent dehydrogenase (short-subunit alcohol dehydrogenase family)